MSRNGSLGQQNMKFSGMINQFPALVALTFGFFCSSAVLPAQALRFTVDLRNGSALTVEVAPRTIDWTNVNADGQMSTREISLDDVQRLVLTAEPASEQVANIRRLISDLGSKDYHRREAAEQTLSDNEIGGPYLALIERHVNDDVYEVRYRINRILRELNSITPGEAATSAKFDRLVLKSGEVLEGDAGDLKIDCTYAGRPLLFNRGQIAGLLQVKTTVPVKQESGPTTVKMFHRFQDFEDAQQTVVDFETSPNGDELTKSTNVSEAFTDLGLRLGIEGNGFVGISGYPFDFKPLSPTGNSVCVFETSGSFPKRFRGVFEIAFCVPEQPSTPAGVQEIGLFLARVGHSRDLIMEAYNADGHLLATVEATEEPCMFGGVKSNELIARVRVLSSPHLFRLDRKIDEDYAIDNIVFSTPQPLPFGNANETGVVRMTNGDQFMVDKVEIRDGQIVFDSKQLDATLEMDLDKVAEIDFANKMLDNSKNWLAMLDDRSIVRVNSGNRLNAIDFGDAKIDEENVAAISFASPVFRYPETADFDKGSTILVFPTCRILTQSVDFRNKEIGWDKNALKIEQPLKTVGKEIDDDPTPPTNSISLTDPTPTIWFRPPVTPASTTGKLHLTDGQQFTLGGEAGFKITRIDKEHISIAWKGADMSFPWQRVRMIKFPTKDN